MAATISLSRGPASHQQFSKQTATGPLAMRSQNIPVYKIN
jgi:hypothetical protein